MILSQAIDFQEETKSTGRKFIGATGIDNTAGFYSDVDFNADWDDKETRFDRVDQMRQSDAQINAVILAHELMLKQATKDFIPFSQDNIDLEINEKTKKAFFNNPQFEFPTFENHYLKHWPYGVYPFEISSFFNKKEGLHYPMIGPRKPHTIERWRLHEDTEILWKIEQQAVINGKWQTKEIYNENLIIFNVNAEGSDYRGQSMLRPVWRNFKLKDNLIRLDGIRHDRFAVPTPIFELPDAEHEDDDAQAKKVGRTYRSHQNAYIVLPNGWKVSFPDIKSSGINIVESINLHNKEITSAFLANFLMVGMTEAGTYNLVENKQDMFFIALRGLANRIENVINERIEQRALVQNFITWNWPDAARAGRFPKFRYTRLASIDFNKFSETLKNLGESGFRFNNQETTDFIIDELGLPKGETLEPIKEVKPNIITNNKPPEENEDDANDIEAHENCNCINCQEDEDKPDFVFWRDPSPIEKAVGIETIRDELEESKNRLVLIGNKNRKIMIDKLIDKGTKLLTKDLSMNEFKKQLNQFSNDVQTGGRGDVGSLLGQTIFVNQMLKPLKFQYRNGRKRVKQEFKDQKNLQDAEDIIVEEGENILRPVAEIAVAGLVTKMLAEFKKQATTQKMNNAINIVGLRRSLDSLTKNDFRREMTENTVTAFGQGRTKEINNLRGDQDVKVHRSEILDKNNCVECFKIDGWEGSIDDPFYQEIASGAYTGCLGGAQCRGVNLYLTEG